MQQLAPFAAGQAYAIIMITQAGVRTEPALDIAEQGDNLLSVPAVNIISYIITGQHHYIDVEHINTLDTSMQICTAYGFAEVKIAYVRYPGSVQPATGILQMKVYFNHFNPFWPDSISVNRPAGTQTKRAQSQTLQIVQPVMCYPATYSCDI
jgi:hypothetical protein